MTYVIVDSIIGAMNIWLKKEKTNNLKRIVLKRKMWRVIVETIDLVLIQNKRVMGKVNILKKDLKICLKVFTQGITNI